MVYRVHAKQYNHLAVSILNLEVFYISLHIPNHLNVTIVAGAFSYNRELIHRM